MDANCPLRNLHTRRRAEATNWQSALYQAPTIHPDRDLLCLFRLYHIRSRLQPPAVIQRIQ
jgi:hypothetical protein